MNALTDMCRRWLVPIVAAACGAAALVVLPAAAVSQDQTSPKASLVLLDGTTVAAKSLAIDDGKVAGEGVPKGLTLDDLRRIDLPVMATDGADRAAVVVQLRGGGRVYGKSATIGDDKCRIEWSIGQPLALPIDAVRAVRFDPSTASSEFDKALAAPAADADRIFFKVDGKTDSVTGLIAGLTAEQLTFQLDGQERTLPKTSILGIVVAQPQADDEAARCLVELLDGSRLGGNLTQLAGDKGLLAVPGGSHVEFPWQAVTKVHVRSSRVAFLSDLKPTAVEESVLVTFPHPWQRDKNVMGKPLVLGSQTFDKGIGVHARSSLTFAADRQFDVLAAVIGIDAQTGGKGDCVFTVLGDEENLFSKRMLGNDSPHDIQIDISRYQQVTLLVEPGEGLDLGDHADWCDIRFVRKR